MKPWELSLGDYFDLFTSAIGVNEPGMTVRDAIGTLSQNRQDKKTIDREGGLSISPVKTPYGTADRTDILNDYVSRMQAEQQEFRNKPAGNVPGELGVGFGEPAPQQPQVKGIIDQYTPPEEPQQVLQGAGIPQSVLDYATGYRYSPAGDFGQSRLNENTLGILWNEINAEYPDLDQRSKETLLANLVAVAQAESGMGGAYGNPDASNYKDSNYWNWFKGGNRGYDPEDFGVMADDIVRGIGGYTLGTGGRFTRDNASTYTGNDNLSFWYDDIYGPAMNAMGY